MSEGRVAAGTAHRVGSGIGRLVRAWRVLPPEQHLAAIAAIGLFLTLFLPWYQATVIATGTKNLQSASATATGWGAFSFVEAAVLLVSAGVLTLLFQRAEGRAFHLPGGDGSVILVAGVWTGLLVVWRMFDKQGTTSHGQYANTYGIEWGIFVALAVAALLAYSGSRIRAAHRPEPPLPEDSAPTDPLPPPPARERAARDRPSPGAETPAGSLGPSDRPARPADHPTQPSPRAERTAGAAPPPAERPPGAATPPPQRSAGAAPPPAERPPGAATPPPQRSAGAAPPPVERPPGAAAPPPQRSAGAANSARQSTGRPVRSPRPVHAAQPVTDRSPRPPRLVRDDDAPTVRMGTPATPAARQRPPAPVDDQLTIPLERDRSERVGRDPAQSPERAS